LRGQVYTCILEVFSEPFIVSDQEDAGSATGKAEADTQTGRRLKKLTTLHLSARSLQILTIN
jgi:hypothetical protein